MFATAAIVVTVDLLWGVIIGFFVAVLVNLIRGGPKNFLKANTEVRTQGDAATLKFNGAVGFNNYMGVRGVLDTLPKGKQLTLDYSGVTFMDHTVRERLHDFKGEYEGEGGTMRVTGESALRPSSNHEFSAMVRAKA